MIGSTAALAGLHDDSPRHVEYAVRKFDDGTVRVRGRLSAEDRSRLELTHFDTGTLIGGWAVWMPKGAGDAD